MLDEAREFELDPVLRQSLEPRGLLTPSAITALVLDGMQLVNLSALAALDWTWMALQRHAAQVHEPAASARRSQSAGLGRCRRTTEQPDHA